MRARAVRQINESAAFPGKTGSLAPSRPVQAKLKVAAPTRWSEEAEQEQLGKVAGRGGSFADMPVFSQQREVHPGQGGSPLPGEFRQWMEAAFGSDFSDVRVHRGPVADSLGALAFTQGRDIHFAPEQYNPASAEGQRIIAHELAHVVQQRQGRVAVPWGGGIPLNESASLESEADALGARAVRGESVAGRAARQGGETKIAGAGVAPVQGLSKLFGRNTKKKGGNTYNKLIDEDEQEAEEMEKLQKSQDKALKSQTKSNISRHYGNLHPKAQRGSDIANKVGKGANYLGKGITLLSGGSDMGIGTMTGKGLQTGIKGTTKGIEMYNKYQDYRDPLTKEQATPLIPKVNPKSNVQSKVEMGGTIAKGLVTGTNEVSEFFGGPTLPTKQINTGIDLATKVGSKLGQKYDEQQNESNMNTGSQYEQNQKTLEDYYQKQNGDEDDWDPFKDWEKF